MTSLNILANYVKACTRLSRCSNIFYKPSKRISPRMDSALPVRRGHEECDAALLHQGHRHHEPAIPWANSVHEGGRRPCSSRSSTTSAATTLPATGTNTYRRHGVGRRTSP
ncbi:unnamed protein product [Musa banksii]